MLPNIVQRGQIHYGRKRCRQCVAPHGMNKQISANWSFFFPIWMENILMASTSFHKTLLDTNDRCISAHIRISKEKDEETLIKHTSK